MNKGVLRGYGSGALAVSAGACLLAACFGSSSGAVADAGDGGAPEANAPFDSGVAVADGPSSDAADATVLADATDAAETFETSADGGCVPGVGLQNGNFTEGLDCWSTVVVSGSGSATIDTSVDYAPTDADCDPLQMGHPFVLLNVYASDVYVSQTFTVPTAAQTLSWVEWNNLDPTTAKVSIVVGGEEGGVETVLDSRVPPSLQALSNPNDDYSVVCSGSAPTPVSESISQFAGQEVELRLRGTYVSGVNGLFTSYANVAIH
jgi:hypothetical protein